MNIPVLNDILFYTQSDAYNYLTDNRPIYQLDDNIRHIASSLVGIGYGEHQTVSGGLLSTGKIVEQLSNGLIKYPDTNTSASSAILGLVIGSRGAGINSVIWGSFNLDLDALGLASLISGATAGQYICSDTNTTGNIIIKSTITDSDLVLGRVRSVPFISIGKDGTTSVVADETPKYNHYNNYGVSRFRNFNLLSSVNATPIQFSKTTAYQSDFPLVQNPLNINLNLSTGQISSASVDPGIVYGLDSNSWVIRESYNQFLTSEIIPNEDVLYGITRNNWSAISYPTTLTNSAMNYELQSIASGLDYTQSQYLSTFKQFNIVKYFQYAKVSVGDPLYGKLTAVVTVFDPKSAQIGGEQTKTLVCEFISYNPTSGLETNRYRTVVTGNVASTLYNDTNIFPDTIKI